MVALSKTSRGNRPVTFLKPMFRLWWFLLTLAAATGFAAGPIVADVKPVASRARSNAPQAIDVKLTVQGTGLLEGVLEISNPSADSTYSCRFRTQELALAAGTRTVRVLLPIIAYWAMENPEVKLRFLTKERAIELGQFPLGINTRAT